MTAGDIRAVDMDPEANVERRQPDSDPGSGAGSGSEQERGRPGSALDPPIEDVPAESAEPEGRRYPSTLGGVLYLLVLAVSAAGLVVVAHDWRVGVRMIAGSLLFAAGARLLLPVRDAGMLAVRRRPVDVVILAAAGAVMLGLSLSIPDQPPL
jgi:hypothetical protein